jgi:hypothetical protein
MWSRRFLAAFLSTFIALQASAFDRAFPQTAKRGTMSPGAYPSIVVDGETRSLSTAARVWNAENLIQVPASLQSSGVAINYTENEQGEVDRVWVLTPEEASRKLAK